MVALKYGWLTGFDELEQRHARASNRVVPPEIIEDARSVSFILIPDSRDLCQASRRLCPPDSGLCL